MLANVNGTASDFDDHHSAMIEIANKQVWKFAMGHFISGFPQALEIMENLENH